MATYAIGDVQGCFHSLQHLLAEIAYDIERDELWFCGDLVNRGTGSLEVLRWAVKQGRRVRAVLGNHDLHLLARAEGVAPARPRDTLDGVLEAGDRDELLAWLRRQPLLARSGDWVLVHAGLLPRWTLEDAEALARAAEHELRTLPASFLARARKKRDARAMREALRGTDRAAAAAAVLTNLRCVTERGDPFLSYSGSPAEAPRGLTPWFNDPERKTKGQAIVFGHWAALGLCLTQKVACLDSGCAWGNDLTAFRLEDRTVFQVPSAAKDRVA